MQCTPLSPVTLQSAQMLYHAALNQYKGEKTLLSSLILAGSIGRYVEVLNDKPTSLTHREARQRRMARLALPSISHVLQLKKVPLKRRPFLKRRRSQRNVETSFDSITKIMNEEKKQLSSFFQKYPLCESDYKSLKKSITKLQVQILHWEPPPAQLFQMITKEEYKRLKNPKFYTIPEVWGTYTDEDGNCYWRSVVQDEKQNCKRFFLLTESWCNRNYSRFRSTQYALEYTLALGEKNEKKMAIVKFWGFPNLSLIECL
jgi:hypothetical protein